jgi:hypothetical protein
MVDWIAQDQRIAMGGGSVHVVSAMLPISGQTFFGGGFYFFE